MSAKLDAVGGGANRAALRVCLSIACGVLAFGLARPARAASVTPDIPAWTRTGAWQDSSAFNEFNCVGSFGPRSDSLRRESRSLTLRFMRDRATEIRPDFGGYRIYRMTNSPDSAHAVLVRRFSLNSGSELTWNASRVTRSSSVSALINNGAGGYRPRLPLLSGLTPSAVATGDVNGDGKPDVVSANQGDNSVSLLFGNAAGGFIGRSDLNVGLPPSDVKLADMNGDGRLDIAAASASDRLFTVLLSLTGSGGFQVPLSISALVGPTALAIGDVTSDGVRDYVLAGAGSDSVEVIVGKPSGAFGSQFFTRVGSRPSAIAIGDVNGDNVADLVVANAGGNSVSVFVGNNSGTFAARQDFATGTSPAGLALRDVNKDNKLDILVTNSGSNTVTELLGNGSGGFTPAADVPTGVSPRGIVATDVDGDGNIDLAVAESGDNTIGVLHGDGSGGFPTRTAVPTGVSPRAVAVADLSGDGKADLFSADFSYELPYICQGGVVNDSVLTFVDPDSNGRYVKICRRPGREGVCDPTSRGDSILILIKPPGPHDGFLTWYSVTIERRNTTDPDYEDLFLPDTLDNFARCTDPANRATCPNLNHKLRNLAGPVEPTTGPTTNLETVLAVPNPYRGSEVWDQPGESEVHFINLPPNAKIRIYTAAGDLVRELLHSDPVRDFERWDLKNASGQIVASGIYMYRVESGLFHFQSRLVVIR